MRELMGPDFPMRPTRLRQLSSDAPELDQLVATLIQNASGAATALIIANDTDAGRPW